MKRIIVCVLCAALLLTLSQGFALDNGALKIYVEKSGSDSGDGSKAHPYATVLRAQRAARELAKAAEADIEVVIGGGTYFQTETLSFNEQDSGKGELKVRYTAAEGEEPVISGGKQISGWREAGDGSWQADVEAPDIIRELYINGEKAKLARTNSKVAGIGLGKEKGSAFTNDGIIFESELLAGAENAEDITLHWSIGWMCYVLKCTGIVPYDKERSLVKVQQPIFDSLSTREANPISGTKGLYLENAKIFMDEPGEFYYDRAERRLYYIPREGQDMKTAEAVVPVLEKIAELKGSDSENKVKNLEFHGLTFAHGAWFLPAQYGYNAVQAQWITIEDYEIVFTPANVTVDYAEDVGFYGNVFTGLGCVGLGIYEDVSRISVVGNAFYDIKDSAISVGLLTHEYIDEPERLYNLARDKTAVASSCTKRRYSAEKALDSLEETGWQPAADDKKPYIQVDLEKPYRIDGISLLFEKGGMQQGSVYASDDADFNERTELTYSSRSKKQIRASFNISRYDGQEYRYSLKSGEAFRYIRVYTAPDSQLNRIKIFDKSRPGVYEEGVCRDSVISGNYITRVADYFWSSPAVVGYYTDSLEISNNHIENIPYTGISLGWGWIYTTDSVTAKDNSIKGNYIRDVMQECYDGGGIYTLGLQPGSVICENYIRGCRLPYGTIYLDGGSVGFTVRDNVTEDVGRYFYNNPADGKNEVFHNFTTTPVFDALNPGTSVRETISFSKFMPTAEIYGIMKNSGLLPQWQYIRKRVPDAEPDYDAFGREGYINITDTSSATGIRSFFLGYEIKAAETMLSMLDEGKLPYEFDGADVEEFRKALYVAKGIIGDSSVSSSAELYKEWQSLQKAYDTLFAARKGPELSELSALAERELSSASAGSGLWQYPQSAIDDFKRYMSGEERYSKSGDSRLDLEQAYNAFSEQRQTMEIKDVKISTLIGKPVIDKTADRVTVYVEQSTDLKKLLPEFTLSAGCHLSAQSARISDYSSEVTLVVKNEDESAYRFWTVTVIKRSATSFN